MRWAHLYRSNVSPHRGRPAPCARRGATRSTARTCRRSRSWARTRSASSTSWPTSWLESADQAVFSLSKLQLFHSLLSSRKYRRCALRAPRWRARCPHCGADELYVVRREQSLVRPFHPELANQQHHLPEALVCPPRGHRLTEACSSVASVNLALPTPRDVHCLVEKRRQAWEHTLGWNTL